MKRLKNDLRHPPYLIDCEKTEPKSMSHTSKSGTNHYMVHSFSESVLRVCFTPGIILGSGDKVVNKTTSFSDWTCFEWGKVTNKYTSKHMKVMSAMKKNKVAGREEGDKEAGESYFLQCLQGRPQ